MLATFVRALGGALLLALALALPAQAADRVLLVLGDSLSAAYGLRPAEGWVALLDARLQKQPARWRVVNASISGETTAGGAARIETELKRHRPHLVLIELGGNDGLRGLAVSHARDNLARMIDVSQKSGARVVLIGMQMPPNFGPDYTAEFSSMYANLAQRYRVALVPAFLEGIGEKRELFQADNIHPTAEAQPRMLENVWRVLAPLVTQSAAPLNKAAAKE